MQRRGKIPDFYKMIRVPIRLKCDGNVPAAEKIESVLLKTTSKQSSMQN